MLRVRDKGELLVLVEEYLGNVKIGATKFGWLATGDLSLVSKLRHKPDYDPHLSTVTKVLNYITEMTADAEDVAEGL